jgi:hypothetical protein
MSQPTPREPNIPVLTEVIRNATSARGHELDELLAEVQTKLASRTFQLADELLRASFKEMEAALLEQIFSKLRSRLPELIDATLREHFEPRGAP